MLMLSGDNGLKKTITDYEGRVSVEHYDLLGRLSKGRFAACRSNAILANL